MAIKPRIKATRRKVLQNQLRRAILGDENGNVDVPNQSGKVYVRFAQEKDDNGNALYSQAVSVWHDPQAIYSPYAGMGVMVGLDENGELCVQKADRKAILSSGVNPRAFNPNDPQRAFVNPRNLTPALCRPVGTSGNPSTLVTVHPLLTDYLGDYVQYSGTQTQASKIDLASYIPTSGNHLLAMVWLDLFTLTPSVTASTAQATTTALDSTDVQECFIARPAESVPLAGFRLVGGATNITTADLFEDYRMWINTPDMIGYENPVLHNTRIQTGLVLATFGSYYAVDANVYAYGTLLNMPVTDGNTSSSGMTSFNVAGDSGTPQSITDGNTLNILGGTGLTSVASATDTLTINLDDTAVVPASYTNANITVDQQGRITSASNGSGGTGTVTSVGVSTNASYLTVGSSPVTTSGTITLNKTTGLTANQVVATPDSVTGVAELRSLVNNDLPTVATTKGGTGITTYTTGDILYASALNTLSKLGIGSASYALVVSGGLPTWAQVSLTAGVTGTLPIANGGTGQTAKTDAFDALAPTTTKGDIIASNGTDNIRLGVGADGTVLTADSTTASGLKWGSAGGSGTVTSVGLSLPTDFTVTNSPVTSSGTLTGTWASQTQNTVLSAPNGSSGTPSFRALVSADIPSLPASIITSGQLALARGGTNADLSATGGTGQFLKQSTVGANITVGTIGTTDLPTVPETKGGTNQTTYTTGDILYASASNTLSKLAIGSSTQVLTVSGGIPSWASSSATGGMVQLVAWTVLGGSGTISLTSISGSYNNLLIVCSLRSDRSATNDALALRINSDSTSANYYRYQVAISGTAGTWNATEGLASVGYIQIGLIPANTATSNYRSLTNIWIRDYASTSRIRTVKSEYTYHVGTTTGNIGQGINTGLWTNTSNAITQLDLFPITGTNFLAGSAYALYAF